MIIKNFLDDVCEKVGVTDDPELRVHLLKELTFLEDEVLSFVGLLNKVYETTVPDSLQVRIPYDFKYPKVLYVNETKYDRKELHEAGDWGGSDSEWMYAIETRRFVPAHDKRLILKASFFEYLNIVTRRSDETIGYGIKLIDDDDNVFGEILDNDNVWYPDNIDDTTLANIKVKIFDSVDDVAAYADVERVEDDDILQILTLFGLYEIKLKDGTKTYFLAENGFAYSSATLTAANLLTRGSLDGNNLLITFSSDVEVGDTVKLEYAAGAQRYINEYQVDIILDRFKNLIKRGAEWKAYEYLKQHRKSKDLEEKFYNALKLGGMEAGRMQSFGKEKVFRPKSNRHANRLPYQR